jgi:hypothetical protein
MECLFSKLKYFRRIATRYEKSRKFYGHCSLSLSPCFGSGKGVAKDQHSPDFL